jgi:Trypsin-co-occurring domain 1
MEEETKGTAARKKPIKTKLPDGTVMYIQATAVGRSATSSEQDVANKLPSFSQAMKSLEGMATSLTSIWEKAKPTNASVEFGLEFAWDSGELLAWLVDSSATASMKIRLEWNKSGLPSATGDSGEQ